MRRHFVKPAHLLFNAWDMDYKSNYQLFWEPQSLINTFNDEQNLYVSAVVETSPGSISAVTLPPLITALSDPKAEIAKKGGK